MVEYQVPNLPEDELLQPNLVEVFETRLQNVELLQVEAPRSMNILCPSREEVF